MALFTTDQFGSPSVVFDSDDPVPDETTVRINTHAHANWAFAAPGAYRLTFEVAADVAGKGPHRHDRHLRVPRRRCDRAAGTGSGATAPAGRRPQRAAGRVGRVGRVLRGHDRSRVGGAVHRRCPWVGGGSGGPERGHGHRRPAPDRRRHRPADLGGRTAAAPRCGRDRDRPLSGVGPVAATGRRRQPQWAVSPSSPGVVAGVAPAEVSAGSLHR